MLHIQIANSFEECQMYCREILSSGCKLVGLDIEANTITGPDGGFYQHTELVQICAPGIISSNDGLFRAMNALPESLKYTQNNIFTIYLFRIGAIYMECNCVPALFSELLRSKNIVKVGCDITLDVDNFYRSYGFKIEGVVDNQLIAKSMGILDISMDKLGMLLFNTGKKKVKRSDPNKIETLGQSSPSIKHSDPNMWSNRLNLPTDSNMWTNRLDPVGQSSPLIGDPSVKTFELAFNRSPAPIKQYIQPGQFIQGTNWGSQLTDDMINYAAYDAYLSYIIYCKLIKIDQSHNSEGIKEVKEVKEESVANYRSYNDAMVTLNILKKNTVFGGKKPPSFETIITVLVNSHRTLSDKRTRQDFSQIIRAQFAHLHDAGIIDFSDDNSIKLLKV